MNAAAGDEGSQGASFALANALETAIGSGEDAIEPGGLRNSSLS